MELKVANSNGHSDDVPEKLQGISMSLQVASAMSNLTILTKSDNEQGEAASIEASIHVLLMRNCEILCQICMLTANSLTNNLV